MSYVVADSRPESLSLIAAQHEDWIIRQAIALLEQRIFKAGPMLNSPAAVRDYLHLKLVAEPNEVFAVVFLNSQHQVLAYEPMFKGTVDQTSVYPRVLVQRALALNASAVILAHFVARHKMRVLCPVFLCAVLGGQERTSWASGQNRGT
ncbi:JAB domain-containing protein [Pseudomonas aeruginosa]|uniref:JAB domain-containing protein n=1 Tax=Pseudomonas aeruginosa TaxID=287 RepID=UPI003DA748B1